MYEVGIGIIALSFLLLLFATGIELGFAMALVGFLGFAYLNGFPAAMQLLARDLYDVVTNYGFTVFPLFILMGQIGFNAGMAVRLFDAAHKFVGHVPGGLAMATVWGPAASRPSAGPPPPPRPPSPAWPSRKWTATATTAGCPRALWPLWGPWVVSFRPASS